MDQFRSSGGGGGGEAKEADSSRVPFNSPPSAFSRPILPASSTLLLPPKPLGGAPNGTSGSGSGSAPDPPAAAAAAGRYRECLRNHAASIGGHVVDGCGEFMPAGPAEPMKCAACGCHRSFHRREPEPVSNLVRVPLLLPPPPPPHGPRTIGFGCSGNTTESSSEERNANHSRAPAGAPDAAAERGRKTKRFRTKFSSEQKEKMTAFAERAEWRVQRKDEAEMERFCRDVGVSRQVLKVWMHNNKHHLLKKQQQHQQAPPVDPPEQQQQQEALAEENAAAR